MCVKDWARVSIGAYSPGQALDFLERFGSHLWWALKTKLGPFAKAVHMPKTEPCLQLRFLFEAMQVCSADI